MLIDRYIGRAQLHAFAVVFVSLAGLYFVFDAFTNMEEFLSHAAESGGLVKILASYYGCRLIWFFDATSPVISLASAMFALSWLERHNELTALLRRLFRARDLLLKVNLSYIESAAQKDDYRTEPPFKLQGSYRNMTKLAGQITPHMRDDELDALLRDHYRGEAQTLTTGADGLSTLLVRCGPLSLVVVLCDGCLLSAWWRTAGGDGAGRAVIARA